MNDKKTSSILSKIFLIISFSLALLVWIVGTNLMFIITALFFCITALIMTINLLVKKDIPNSFLIGLLIVMFAHFTLSVFNGADSGFGAFISGRTGYKSIEHFQSQNGGFIIRYIGNLLIFMPSLLLICVLFITKTSEKIKTKTKKFILTSAAIALIFSNTAFVFTMNLRLKPKVFRLFKGEREYLDSIKRNANNSNPNVIFIMTDDLGYGDTSFNGNKAFKTPNIDSIAQNGVNLDNFYSSYSVCSPSRFAALTGRYPYRGYADNVIYPTVNTASPFLTTRQFNAIEMENNCDGMLADEITIAEVLQKSGYSTGCFGKWHLGDYGEYLPTNQGFDYFYGSHHVNDMKPFYHVREEKGNYEILQGVEKINQKNATKIIHEEVTNWIDEKSKEDKPFFMFYTTPWPHAPLYASDEFIGKSGAGVYGDSIMEFDHYLGKTIEQLKVNGEFDNTIFIFTSDNGPALQGSTNNLRGGKFTPYDGGQKVPCYIYHPNDLRLSGSKTISAPVTMVDFFPTLVDLCKIENIENKFNYLPSDVDRIIDGRSIVPLINGDREYIHDASNPILHMKRGKIRAIQYSMDKNELKNHVSSYSLTNTDKTQTGESLDYLALDLINNYDYTTWKYFKKVENDNPAFFNLKRVKWLVCLTDDEGESYQRAKAFPSIEKEINDLTEKIRKDFKSNRRGIIKTYYKK